MSGNRFVEFLSDLLKVTQLEKGKIEMRRFSEISWQKLFFFSPHFKEDTCPSWC